MKSSFPLKFQNKIPKLCPHISFLKVDIEGEIADYKNDLCNYYKDLDVNKNNFLQTYQTSYHMKLVSQLIVMMQIQ